MNLANVWEAVADELGEFPALLHGGLERSWTEFEDRSARVAGHLERNGLGPDSKVALYLHNGPEYAEATFAAFKCRAVPVNVNYRYLSQELEYLLDNSDAEAVVVSAVLLDRLEEVVGRLEQIRTVLVVGVDAAIGLPELSVDVEVVDFESVARDAAPAERRSGEMSDLWFLYTGGTTGMPKGVMWPHRSLLESAAPTFRIVGADVPATPAEAAATARRFAERGSQREDAGCRPTHARHGRDPDARRPERRRVGRDSQLPLLRRSGALRRGAARSCRTAKHRRRRVRQADRGRARISQGCRPSLGSVVAEGRGELWSHVEPGHQGRTPGALRRGAGGPVGILGGHRYSQFGLPPRS